MRVLERTAKLRQCRSDPIAKHARIDSLDAARRIEVALRVTGERAVRTKTCEILIERVAKRCLGRRNRPCKLTARACCECDVEVEIDVAGNRRIVRGNDRIVHGPVRNLRNERFRCRDIDGFPCRLRMHVTKRRQLRVETGARRIGDGRVLQIGKRFRFVAIDVIDQHRLHRIDSGGPQHAQRDIAHRGHRIRCIGCIRSRIVFRRCCLNQSADADIGVAAFHFSEQFRSARSGPADHDRNRRVRRRRRGTSSRVQDVRPRRSRSTVRVRVEVPARTPTTVPAHRPMRLRRRSVRRFSTNLAFRPIIAIIMPTSWRETRERALDPYNVARMAGRPALQGRESGQVRKEAATANRTSAGGTARHPLFKSCCAPRLLCRVLARPSPYLHVLSRGSLRAFAHSRRSPAFDLVVARALKSRR